MSAYREQLRACPACTTPMDALPVAGDAEDASVRAEADACARCGGLFLEFFDGEPAAISRGIVRDGGVARARGTPAGELTCPDCAAPMVKKAYLGHGPELARCEGCLAVFLAPHEVELLASLVLPPEEPRTEPSWLERLVAWLPGLSGAR